MSRQSSFSSSSSCLIVSIVIVVIIFLSVEEKLFESLDSLYSEQSVSNTYPNQNIHLKGVLTNVASNAISPRLKNYCSVHPYKEDKEGKFEGSDKWRLNHIVVNIRHGDRSAIHSMPNSYNKLRQYEHSSPHYLDPRAVNYIPRFSSFQLAPITSGLLPDALNETVVFRNSDYLLSPGLLTTRGFMQHVELGEIFAKAYPNLLKEIETPKDIYVRSTNYERTIQSALAFLTSMLPNIGGPLQPVT